MQYFQNANSKQMVGHAEVAAKAVVDTRGTSAIANANAARIFFMTFSYSKRDLFSFGRTLCPLIWQIARQRQVDRVMVSTCRICSRKRAVFEADESQRPAPNQRRYPYGVSNSPIG
jgi:hypothetical protein